MKGGSIFVSDGYASILFYMIIIHRGVSSRYCNDRVVELTLDGKYRSEFKGTGGFRYTVSPENIIEY